MPKYLITGVAGTGKSSIAEVMKKQGYDAVDIDADTSIGYSKNLETGNKDVVPNPRPENWRLNHRWFWDSEKFNNYLNIHNYRDLFMFGIAENQSDFFKYFDKIFVLIVDEVNLVGRLKTRTNNEFGKQQLELDEVLNRYPGINDSILSLGGIALDNSGSIDEVIKEIREYTNV